MYRLIETFTDDLGTKWYFFETPNRPFSRFQCSYGWFWHGYGL